MFETHLLLPLLFLLPQCLEGYDCYDQSCRGTGNYLDTYITCNQEYNRCDSDPMAGGFPLCVKGPPGSGVYCHGGTFFCYADENGIAYCDYPSYSSDWVIIGPCLAGGVMIIISAVCCYVKMHKPVNHTFIIQPAGQDQSQPWIVNTATAQPVLLQQPEDPGYGSTGDTKVLLRNAGLPPEYPGLSGEDDLLEPPAYEPVSPTAPPESEYNIYPSI